MTLATPFSLFTTFFDRLCLLLILMPALMKPALAVRVVRSPRSCQLCRVPSSSSSWQAPAARLAFHAMNGGFQRPFSGNLSLFLRGGGGERRNTPSCGDRRLLSTAAGSQTVTFATNAQQEADYKILQRYPVTGCAAIGWRPYMEDEALIQGDLVAVFDGHGGDSVSKYLRKNIYGHIQAILPRAMEERLNEKMPSPKPDWEIPEESSAATMKLATLPTAVDYKLTLDRALAKINQEVSRITHWSFQGSTAVVVWLHETDRTAETNADDPVAATEEDDSVVRTLIAANVGDSRLVLSRDGQAVALSRDHKPNDPIEEAYIESQGGHITWPYGVPRVNGNLALSRAIGDRAEQPCVRAEADLIHVELTKTDDFYVLATDGLWDVMSNQDVVSFLQQCSLSEAVSGEDRQELTKSLVVEALARGAEDNITVLVVWLR
jgi:serine/threonine protein phosphatase PrpC